MRTALFILSSLIYFSTNAQLLDPTTEWFGLKDFFNEAIIKERAITFLDISISTKADGKAIEEAGEKITYAFNASGELIWAKKRIPMYRGFDTSWVKIQYDDQDRMNRLEEHHGPYHFEYVYQFQSDSLFKSLKLRPSNEGFDTLYYRNHLITNGIDEETERIANKKGVAFLTKQRKYDSLHQLIEERMEYIFSKNQSTSTYTYENGLLVEKRYKMDYGQKSNSLKEFNYKNGNLDEVRVSEKGKVCKRIAFTFKDDLPSAAVVRLVEDKEIKIYRFKYTFY